MKKNCEKNFNQEGAGAGQKIQIDYVSEVFYACKFDCCHFAVHEDCFGGAKSFADIYKKKEKVEIEEEKAYKQEEEKPIEMKSCFETKSGYMRTPYDVIVNKAATDETAAALEIREFERTEFPLKCGRGNVYELKPKNSKDAQDFMND